MVEQQRLGVQEAAGGGAIGAPLAGLPGGRGGGAQSIPLGRPACRGGEVRQALLLVGRPGGGGGGGGRVLRHLRCHGGSARRRRNASSWQRRAAAFGGGGGPRGELVFLQRVAVAAGEQPKRRCWTRRGALAPGRAGGFPRLELMAEPPAPLGLSFGMPPRRVRLDRVVLLALVLPPKMHRQSALC